MAVQPFCLSLPWWVFIKVASRVCPIKCIFRLLCICLPVCVIVYCKLQRFCRVGFHSPTRLGGGSGQGGSSPRNLNTDNPFLHLSGLFPDMKAAVRIFPWMSLLAFDSSRLLLCPSLYLLVLCRSFVYPCVVKAFPWVSFVLGIFLLVCDSSI